MDSSDPAPAVLTVWLAGEPVARATLADVPCELTISREVSPDSAVDFVTATERHTHSLGELSGWAHLSVRIHPSLGCQADCAVTQHEAYDPQDLLEGRGSGVRFQPFFLTGAGADPVSLHGKGMFQRGLHFSGLVTPGSVRLSCECDACHCSFHVQSYHAGFSQADYMYSTSGRFTLMIDGNTPGVPGALGRPDPQALAALEAALPLAPDGTRFAYLNPFRCPHCSAAFIDFERFPELRPGEYYANVQFGTALLHYPPRDAAPAPRKTWLKQILGR